MRTARAFAIALVIGLATILPASVRSQTPEATPGSTGLIVTMPVGQLPGPHTEVWLLRFNFPPGAVLPGGEQAGPTLFVLESGELTVSSDAAMTTYSPERGAEAGQPGTIQLLADAGPTAILVPDRARLSVRNDGTEDASALVLLLMSAEREVEIMQTQEASGETDDMSGAAAEPTIQGLAVGQAAFGTGPGTVTIERAILEAGGTTSTSGGPSVEAGVIEAGDAGYEVRTGSGIIWPGLARAEGQMIDPVMLESGASGSISTSDGYFFGTDTDASITASSGGVVLLRAIVTEQSNSTPVS